MRMATSVTATDSSISSSSSSSSTGDSSRSSISSNSRRPGIQVAASNFIQGRLSALFEYSGFELGGGGRGGRSSSQETDYLHVGNSNNETSPISSHGDEEEEEAVSITIVGAAEAEHDNLAAHHHVPANPANVSLPDLTNSGGTTSTSSYDFQYLASWAEQVLPFSLLLLLVFIRQHLQGISLLLRLLFSFPLFPPYVLCSSSPIMLLYSPYSQESQTINKLETYGIYI